MGPSHRSSRSGGRCSACRTIDAGPGPEGVQGHCDACGEEGECRGCDELGQLTVVEGREDHRVAATP
eukprot:6776680-Heterocapsa_arctica.AAC.1